MDIIKDEGVFRLYDHQATLILTDEKQLRRIAEHPEMPLFDDEERGFSGEKKGLYPAGTTLDSFMRDAHARGVTRVEVSYDFFFGGSKRENYPDSPLTIKAYKVICEYAARYGMAFGASVVSPLDLGGGYVKTHKDTGYTWQMAEGALVNGEYRVEMRRQRQWYNNKGPIALKLRSVRVLAFDERPAENGRDFYVPYDSVVDISDTAAYRVEENSYHLTGAGYAYDRMTVHGRTGLWRDRVMILAEYQTPEQDYFAPDALDYMKEVLDKHAKNGISYQGFYSDEMHIQFDWDLTEHFGPTEIQTRYVTDSLIDTFAARYGERFRDFAGHMVYFLYTKHEDGRFHNHMMGPDAAGAYDTVLFRKRYFEMLSERVVGLSMDAKAYAESIFEKPIMTRAHATWQESPTCDHFAEDFAFSEQNRREICRYDYDKPYVWSSTIRENQSACGDYFRWNEYLTGSGTDHPEGGNIDRDYYAQAFACSLGALNRFDRAYCANWGSPAPVSRRFAAVGAAYGTGSLEHAMVQNLRHRLSDVLVLYPTQLNYAEERFGSWMVQYGYCDYITQEKLLAYAVPSNDALLHVRGRAYRAVVAMFEPFVDRKTVELLSDFIVRGGKLLWTGPAPLRFEDGESAKGAFQQVFGLASVATLNAGVRSEDAKITFIGSFEGISPMEARTGLLPDAFYPVVPAEAEVVATLGDRPVGARIRRGKGEAVYLGFRPRDDQSQSTGKDVSTLFDILSRMNAYAPDSLEAASRPASARYLMNRFENGCVTVANHYRTFAEDWYGSFFRDEEKDRRLLEGRELPPIEIELKNAALNGSRVTCRATDAISFRVNAEGTLNGFAGSGTDGIEVDGRRYALFSEPAELCFAEMEPSRLADGVKHLILLKADRPGTFTLPRLPGFEHPKAGVCDRDYFKISASVPVLAEEAALRVTIKPEHAGKWHAVYAE